MTVAGKTILSLFLALCVTEVARAEHVVSREERLDRAVDAATSAWRDRIPKTRALLERIRKVALPRHVRALENVLIADGIERAARAHEMKPSDPARRTLLLDAAEELALAQPDHVAALVARGWLKRETGDLAGAARDLEAAVNLKPDDGSAREDLARTRWRLGDHETAIRLMDEGLVQSGNRPGAEVFVRMLRALARGGEDQRARALAERQLTIARSEEVKSAFHGYLTEAKITSQDLSGAVDSLLQTREQDRTWLIGGLVRAGRALASTPAGRNTVLTAIDARTLEMPTAVLRLAGDLRHEVGQDEASIRRYAASLTGGDEEARELVEHVQASGLPFAPGAMVNVMASVGPSHGAARLAPIAYTPSPLDQLGALPLMAPLRGESAARATDLLLGLLPAAGQRSPEQIDAAVRRISVGRERPVGPTRRRLLTEVLAGKTAEAKRTLDALALTSWHANDPRPVGSPVDVAYYASVGNFPLTRAHEHPETVDAVAAALRELNDPQTPERRQLERIMEVAKQEVNAPVVSRDPIAIDCDASGNIEMTSSADEPRAVQFDLDGWGIANRTQWLAGGDGWLCEDVDRDGKISSGRELFGNAGGFSDGFEKLALRDANHDGVISGAELAGLSIWIDRDNPGVTDPGELTPVEVAGLTAVSIPRVGLRAVATLNGHKRLCLEVWPEAFAPRFAQW